MIRESLRHQMRSMKQTADKPYKETVIEIFNRIFGDNGGSDQFWATEVPKLVLHKVLEFYDIIMTFYSLEMER